MANVPGQIGSYYFVALTGDLDVAGDTVEEITRPAVDGRAFRKIGARGEPSVLFGAAVVETSTEAETLIDNYKALQATLVSIVIAKESRANYLILEVGAFDRQEIYTPVGGVLSDGSAIVDDTTDYWLVTSRWAVVYGGT